MKYFDRNLVLYLFNSTIESIEQCKNWFVNSISKQQSSTPRNILLFYCSNDRQPEVLLQPLMVKISFFLLSNFLFHISSNVNSIVLLFVHLLQHQQLLIIILKQIQNLAMVIRSIF